MWVLVKEGDFPWAHNNEWWDIGWPKQDGGNTMLDSAYLSDEDPNFSRIFKSFRKLYSNREQVRKILSLPKAWQWKVDKKSGNLNSLTYNDLREILIAYERTYL